MNIFEAADKLIKLNNEFQAHGIDFSKVLAKANIPISKKLPQPYVFENEDEFNNALEKSVPFVNKYFSNRYYSIQEAVFDSVGRNTFRAFHFKTFKANTTPSKLYRDITISIFESNIDQFINLQTVEDYENFVIDKSKIIEKEFDSAVNKDGFMGFGRAAKLFNLTCKSIIRLSDIPNGQQCRLIFLAQVPWDSFTIQGIRLLSPPFSIKKNESMKWEKMNSVDDYKVMQNWIREKCQRINLCPIHYEFAAWNMAH